MPVPVPADKRFRRAHVRPAPRPSWRPSWRRAGSGVVIGGLLVFATYQAAGLVLAADGLTISSITISGTNRMSPGEVLALLQGLRGENMVTADLDGWRRKLLESPWVEAAAMRRVFPGTIAVVIAEREPLAIGRIGDSLYLVDQRGTIIDEFGPNYAEYDLPIVDGLAAAPGDTGTLIDPRRAMLAARLLDDVQRRPALARRISQIDVSDPRDAGVLLKDDPALVRVGADRFAERLQAYLDLAPRLQQEVPQMDYVDMRFDERVYVRPTGPGRGR